MVKRRTSKRKKTSRSVGKGAAHGKALAFLWKRMIEERKAAAEFNRLIKGDIGTLTTSMRSFAHNVPRGGLLTSSRQPLSGPGKTPRGIYQKLIKKTGGSDTRANRIYREMSREEVKRKRAKILQKHRAGLRKI